MINSWIGTGQNQAISPNKLRQALGEKTVNDLSRQSGAPQDDLLSQLSKYLPAVVDQVDAERATSKPDGPALGPTKPVTRREIAKYAGRAALPGSSAFPRWRGARLAWAPDPKGVTAGPRAAPRLARVCSPLPQRRSGLAFLTRPRDLTWQACPITRTTAAVWRRLATQPSAAPWMG